MALRRCIVVWPAQLTSRLVRARQSTRPRRLMAVSSFAHGEIALLLQAAHSNYQIGAFENFHQLVEDIFIVLRPGPKVFFQYELGFVNCLKSQLLISHLFFPIKKCRPAGKKKQEIKPPFRRYPRIFGLSDQFLFQYGGPQRPIATLPGSTPLPSPLGTFGGCAPEPALGVGCKRQPPDSRAVEKDRQPSLIAVDGAVALRVVRAGDVQFARPELGVRDGHEVVASLHQR